MGFSLAIERSKPLIHAATWMKLEKINAGRKGPVSEGYILYDYFHMTCSKRENHSDRKWIRVVRGKGWKEDITIEVRVRACDGAVLCPVGGGSGPRNLYMC